VPHGDPQAIAAPAVTPLVSGPAGPAGTPPATAQDRAPGAGVVGLLLHRPAGEPNAAGQSSWKPLPQNAPLATREQLLAPPFCRPEVTVDGVAIRLEPNTLATLARDADGAPRLEVVFGRAVVRSNAARPRLGITAGDLVGVVTDGLREPLCVEVTLERAAGTEAAATPSRVRATVATIKSGIAWRQSQADGSAATQPLTGMDAETQLEAGRKLVWDSLDPAKAAVEPLEKGLRELAKDSRSENRMAAAATLALLGDYDELVGLLSAETADRRLQEGQWSRLVDMTVPLALARGVNAAAQFGKACEAHGPAGKGAELLALARGVDDEALAAGGDEQLVAALEAPELVLRRLAIRQLLAITAPPAVDRIRYLADRPEDARRDGVAWWRSQLTAGRIRRAAAAPVP
jgi:hypothetical protein